MNFLEEVPAIRRLETNRDDLFAVDIVGEVTPADAENLYGLLEAAYALHPHIDVLVRLTDFEGAQWAEISPQTFEQGRETALRHVKRCASVGGPDWTGLLGSELPEGAEIRHFPAGEEAEAWHWLGAQPRDTA
ncbi:STAS/SEC14 domain-containing protein [Aquamicrobium terrae]|uniref:STAS/SEC14 domain-containing protein n=1 Tax=Aquamicrobium terrae TaxID=1324945 RepID=A0ABV2MT68_9HYPH